MRILRRHFGFALGRASPSHADHIGSDLVPLRRAAGIGSRVPHYGRMVWLLPGSVLVLLGLASLSSHP